MAKNPGQIITEDIMAALVSDAFAQLHTLATKKAGIYPFNLGEVSDDNLLLRRHLQNQSLKFRHSLQNKSQDLRNSMQRVTMCRILPTQCGKVSYHPNPESVSSAATSTFASISSSVSVPASVIIHLSNCYHVQRRCIMNCWYYLNLCQLKQVEEEKQSTTTTDAMVLQEMKEKEQTAADAKKMKEEKS